MTRLCGKLASKTIKFKTKFTLAFPILRTEPVRHNRCLCCWVDPNILFCPLKTKRAGLFGRVDLVYLVKKTVSRVPSRLSYMTAGTLISIKIVSLTVPRPKASAVRRVASNGQCRRNSNFLFAVATERQTAYDPAARRRTL